MLNRGLQFALLTVAHALVGVWLAAGNIPVVGAENADAKQDAYRSPIAVVVSPDGKTAYVSDRTAGNVTVLDIAGKKKLGEVALHGQPRGLALSADGKRLYVAEHGAGTVAVIDTSASSVASRFDVGRWPTAVAIAENAKRLLVCNQDRHSVTVIDLAQGKTIGEIPVRREPSSVVFTPDERFAIVTNLLPHGVGDDPQLAAEVSILDNAKLAVAASVKLPLGSTAVYGACVSPDGKLAYVVHPLGRFNLPITQLERGWVNTFALSVIDIAQGTRPVTVLLDDLTQGAADPYAVVCSRDGSRLWISHAGVHSISQIDIGLVHRLLAGDVPAELAALKDGSQPNIWMRIKEDPQQVVELENDLTALYIAGAIRRFASGGNGPRGIALTPDEQQLLVTNYFSGSLAVLDAANGKVVETISLGAQPQTNDVRRGEQIFHDATHAFQHWHSCATCHPNEGRVDGLRWDFLGDGIGNAKDTMNLLWLHKTEPLNRRATIASAKACTEGGLKFTNMLVPTAAQVDDLYAYLTSLTPVPSYHLTVDGKLTETAARGQVLFEGKAGCARCHPAPIFTDNLMHNVGVLSANEPDGRYNTPSLVEAYRTAPYLHDGRALTIKDVLTTHNEDGHHGKAKGLTPQEIDDLVDYVLSL
jgi:YVTN family beta-propeller protein